MSPAFFVHKKKGDGNMDITNIVIVIGTVSNYSTGECKKAGTYYSNVYLKLNNGTDKEGKRHYQMMACKKFSKTPIDLKIKKGDKIIVLGELRTDYTRDENSQIKESERFIKIWSVSNLSDDSEDAAEYQPPNSVQNMMLSGMMQSIGMPYNMPNIMNVPGGIPNMNMPYMNMPNMSVPNMNTQHIPDSTPPMMVNMETYNQSAPQASQSEFEAVRKGDQIPF